MKRLNRRPWRKKMPKIKVGEFVDAYDLRDGFLLERNRKVLKIEEHDIPMLKGHQMVDVKKTMVLIDGLDAWIPVRCVRKTGTPL